MKVLFLIIFILMFCDVFAQQDPQFSQNTLNSLTVNPAEFGQDTLSHVSLLSRQQWMSVEGAPETQTVNFDLPFKIGKHKLGGGMSVINDKILFFTNTNINLNLSLHKPFKGGEFSYGLRVGLYNQKIDPKWKAPSEIEDFNKNVGLGSGTLYDFTNDPILTALNTSMDDMALDLGLGFTFRKNNYFVGLSLLHLNKPTIEYTEGVEVKMLRSYYLDLRYNINAGKGVRIKPSLLLKTDLNVMQYDFNVTGYYKKYWAGISLRREKTFSFQLGMNFTPELKAGYATDYSFSSYGSYVGYTQELFISYAFDIDFEKKVKNYKSIRLL